MQFIKNNYIKILIGLISTLVIFLLAYYFIFKKSEKEVTIRPVRQGITQVVEVSGAVEPSKKSDISFERSGTVQNINVKVGDKVRQGQVLASLSGADAASSVLEAEAGVLSAQASLQNVKSGATQAEIDIKTQNLENAKLDLSAVESQIQDTIRNTDNSIKDIIGYKLSSLFYKDTSSYRATFNSCDQAAQSSIEQDRYYFDNIKVTSFESAKSETEKLNIFVSKISSLFSLPCSTSDTSLADKRLTVSGVKTQVQSIFSDISAKNSLLQNSKNAISRAEKDLSLTTSSADKNRVKIAEAALGQAYARLSSAKNQASKNFLTSPFEGVVSQVNLEKGEVSSQSKSAITVISNSKYQIKSKIAEADIAKIKISDSAKVTVDAYPGEEFLATVTRVDPASTNDGGVPRYGVTLTFVENYEKLKSGMTANADITTETKDSVLVIPVSFIDIKSGGGIVKVKRLEGKIEEVIVKTGTRSRDGKIEITEGLTEQDVLVQIAKDGTIKR